MAGYYYKLDFQCQTKAWMMIYVYAVADLGGGMHPPTSLKVTILAEKSASISNNSAPFRDASPPTSPNVANPAEKSLSKLVKTFFFFFFGDHLILGEKIVWISDFGRKITLNFGEDIRIFEVLCLKSPPTKIFWIRHCVWTVLLGWYRWSTIKQNASARPAWLLLLITA